jgi:hypothetical protein
MRASFVLLVSCVIAAGCSSGTDKWKANRPKTVPATGTISLNGQPLEEAQVVLVPSGGSHGASALSNASGMFALQTFPPDDGVVSGTYKVMVIKSLVPQNPDPGSPESKVPQRAKLLIPKKYTDANTSGLEIVVPETGKTDIKLELTGTTPS